MKTTIEQLRENEENAYCIYGQIAAQAANEYKIAKDGDWLGFITGTTYASFLKAEQDYKTAHELVSNALKNNNGN